MDDLNAGTSVADAPSGGGAAAPETKPGGDQTPSGQGAPDNAGDGQDPAAGSTGGDPGAGSRGDTPPPRRRPMVHDLSRLRAQNREWATRFEQLESGFNELRELLKRGAGNGGTPKKSYWDDPEGSTANIVERAVSGMEERLSQGLQKRLDTFRQTQEREQRIAEASALIEQSVPGLTEEDELEIADIIERRGLARLGPVAAAEIAVDLFKSQRGLTDKTPLKRKATVPAGGPTLPGKKIWTVGEIDDAINRKGLTPELEKELRAAEAEGRIKE